MRRAVASRGNEVGKRKRKVAVVGRRGTLSLQRTAGEEKVEKQRGRRSTREVKAPLLAEGNWGKEQSDRQGGAEPTHTHESRCSCRCTDVHTHTH